jgi:hypothetical protein
VNQIYDSASYTNRYQPERTIYQDDGRIAHRAGFTYAVVVRLTDPRGDGGVFSATARLSDGTAAILRLSSITPATLRLQFGAAGANFADESPSRVDSCPTAAAN